MIRRIVGTLAVTEHGAVVSVLGVALQTATSLALSAGLRFALRSATTNFNTNSRMNLFGSTSPVRQIPFVPVSTKLICPNTLNLERAVDGIANELRQILDVKIAEFKAHVTSPAAEWETFVESKGVRGLRRFEGGRQLAIIRSESVLPFHIVDIFEFVDNVKNASVLDPAINHMKVLKRFTDHSWVSCITLHGVSFLLIAQSGCTLTTSRGCRSAMVDDQSQGVRGFLPLAPTGGRQRHLCALLHAFRRAETRERRSRARLGHAGRVSAAAHRGRLRHRRAYGLRRKLLVPTMCGVKTTA